MRERDYLLFDFPFRLRFGDSALEQAAHRLFQHLEAHNPEPAPREFYLAAEGSGYSLWADGEPLLRATPRDEALIQLVYEVGESACRQYDWLAVLHAAGLSDGRECIVLPGRAGSGKTTLTAALVRTGLLYLGDDSIPLESHGLYAVPMPIAMKLKPGSWPALQALYPELETLPAYRYRGQTVRFLCPPSYADGPPRRGYPVAKILFPRYRAEAATRLRPLSAVEVLQGLVESESLFGRPLEKNKVGRLLAWVEQVPGYELVYSKLDEAVAEVGRLWGK